MIKSLIKKALDKHTKNNSFRFSFLVSRFSFLAISVFLIATSANSQIKIKERVEISPQEIISDYIPPQYTPCGPYILQTDYYNPYQVIWNGGWFYIDPFQQLFNYQRNYYTYSLDPGHYYNVTITTGAEYCYIVKSGYWDPDEDEFYYPEIIGDELLNVQGIKLIGTGDWVSAICSRWEKENPPGYYILFERDVPEGSEVIIRIDDLTVGNSINYHTRIEIPLMELENRTDLDTLYHFYARFINVEAKRSEIHSQCGACWGQFPSSVRFTIEVVQGQEYGSLYDTETDEFALSFTNIETEWGSGFIFNYEDGERFKYVADGIQPDSSEPGLVTIRITPSDGNLNTIEFSFFVAYNEDPPEEGVIVIFAEQQIAPGDTTQIILKRRSSDGTLEDFSEWDSFEIGMLEGCDAGKILVGGVLAPYFEEVNQPIYFVAASNLTETDTVKVRVGLIESSASSIAKINDKEKEILTLRKNTTKLQKTFGANYATYCFPGEIDWPKMGDGFVVVGDECDNYICNEVIIKPSFTFESFPNGTFNKDVCDKEQEESDYVVTGVNSVIWSEVNYKEYLKTENITACYEPTLDKWKFGTNKPLYPYFKVIMDVCTTNITKKGYRPLEDIADICDPAKWNDPDVCAAKKDLEGHKFYPSKVRSGGYIFLEVDMAHEMAHGQDFQWVIDSLQSAFLYPTLDSFEVNCGNDDVLNRKANDKEEAKRIFLSEYQKIIMGETAKGIQIKKGFEQKLFDGYKSHIKQAFMIDKKEGSKSIKIKIDHENYINNFPIVTTTIDVILSEFKTIWDCN